MKIKWQTPPESAFTKKTKGRKPSPPVLTQLQERVGEWALVGRYKTEKGALVAKSGLKKKGLEAVSSGNKVWARAATVPAGNGGNRGRE